MVGLYQCQCICVLITNAQPFGLLVGRHVIGVVWETVHNFIESLIHDIDGLKDIINSFVHDFLHIGSNW